MDELRAYNPGDLIFEEGTIGDAMLMIREGTVEILKHTTDGEVLLTVQNPGELVGVFTYFNRGRRLASARARTRVVGQLIGRGTGPDPMQSLPKWVQVVIRDFSTRIEQINNQYAKALQEKKEIEKKVMDLVQLSAQLASCLAELSVYKAKKADDGREMVLLSEMIDMLEASLGYERNELEGVIGVFKAMGLLKVELEPDRGQEVIALGAAQRLKWYADFVRSTRIGKNKKLLQVQVPFKSRKQLFALRDYVQKMGGDLNKTYKEDFKNLEAFQAQFKAKTKLNIDEQALDGGEKLGLLEVKHVPNKTTISFHPTSLVRTLIALNVIRRLQAGPGASGLGEDVEENT